jgi:LacI family transcriptional regulator
MATIYDVAKKAGVSPKTVSRVLNGDGPVGPETRDLVETAMRELGFVRSNAARMMRSQKSGIVGLITGAITAKNLPVNKQGLPDLFIVQGIQLAMAQAGMTLMIADTAGRQDNVQHLFDTFLSHRVEGLIYVAEFHQEVTLPSIPAETPLVLANCFDTRNTPAILPDDRRGQRDLVTRVIAAGHRRIAYLALRPSMVAGVLRPLGYKDALSAANIAFDAALFAHCDFDQPITGPQLLWNTIDQMLSLPNPPSVICCGTDQMAMMVYGILRSMGKRLPDQISVAGYDNFEIIAETLYPPLTTVDLPYTTMGVRAAQRLLTLISGQGRDDRSATLVAGPVHWRSSVTETRTSNVLNLKTVREV